MSKLPPSLDWPLIRQMAAASARAYKETTFCDSNTDAAVLIYVTNGKLVVAFQGSNSPKDFVQDLKGELTRAVVNRTRRRNALAGVMWHGKWCAKVHTGFNEDWEALAERTVSLVNDLLRNRPELKVLVTGHSLGGALAEIAAMEFVSNHIPVESVITFGKPRVGNHEWASLYDAALGWKTFRLVNANDIVTRLPLWCMGYRHAGQEVFLLPFAGWVLNPPLWKIAVADVWGLCRAVRTLDDVLVKEHFIAAYQHRTQLI